MNYELFFEYNGERYKRLTAPKFGEIYKMRANTSCNVKVQKLLYYSSITCKEITISVVYELLAKTRFQELTGITVKLYVDFLLTMNTYI